MYHKKPDKPDKSLAKWVEEKNSKLTDEKQHLQDNLLKIDSKIINPLGVSDYQVKLLKIQRNAMMTVVNVLDMRISDLSVEDD